MPYSWTPTDADNADTLRLWPHRSLGPNGFVWFIGGTAMLIATPLMAVLATPIFWGLLPFLAAAMAALWWALRRSWADREIIEELVLTPDRVTLTRTGPRKQHQTWEANPHWVRVNRHETGGPVPHYLTLSGGPREVELGAFLTPEERMTLEWDLRQRLRSRR